MDLFNYAEWERLENYHRELALIGIGFFVLVTILGCLVFKLGGQLSIDKLTSHPYVRFVYACVIKPHEAKYDDGQQSALESFYSAQVGGTTLILS